MLLLYGIGRISQIYNDRLPTLLIVLLHVIPPAGFAFAHGAALYKQKGIAMFAVFCLGIGSLSEILSLRTGVPFGHYYFTEVMGPKIAGLPILLALAYLGIGYVAWVLAIVILGYVDKPLRGMRLLAMPLLASLIMVSWDLSMDPAWSTLDRAWIWRDGGGYFGVPISNFLGWFLTAYLYYQAFALYCGAKSLTAPQLTRGYWLPAILLYAACALGNPLLLKLPAPPVAADPTGKQWLTADILDGCVLVSLLVMTPLALLAWVRMHEFTISNPRNRKTDDRAVSCVNSEATHPRSPRGG